MERKVWVDYAKAIGITTVVMGHSTYDMPHLVDIIFLFHMPLFFFISGYLFNAKKELSQITNSNKKTLAIPFLLFNVIAMFAYTIQGVIAKHLGQDPNWDFRFWSPLQRTLLGQADGMFVGPSWFLLALIWCKYIMWIIVNGKRWHAIAMIGIVITLLGVRLQTREAFPYSIDIACIGIWPFAIGYWFRQSGELHISNRKHNKAILALLGATMMLLFYHWGARVNYMKANIGGVLGICATIGGVTMIYNISRILESCHTKCIEQVSRASILIMCLHMLIANSLNKALHYQGHTFVTFMGDISIVIILTLSYPLVQRYCPTLIGRRK